MAWIDVDDRLPDVGRWVKVWGDLCVSDYPAPVACRRYEPNQVVPRVWFWSATEARGSNLIGWWWDGPAAPPPRAPGVATGPLDLSPAGDELRRRYEAAGLPDPSE